MNHNPSESNTVLLLPNNGMGIANTEMQHKLLRNYLSIINDNGYFPKTICFYTEGVKLVITGSPILQQLKSLEGKGVRLVICLTCLKDFGVYDQVQVGTIGSMMDIIEAQRDAEKVITL